MSKTSAAEESLPGVTLHLRESREYYVAGKSKAEMVVECSIDDKEVWDAVHKMFLAGFRVYTQEDFKGEMLNVFRAEVNQLETKVLQLQHEISRRDRELLFVKEELEEKKGILDGFAKAFRG